MSESVAYFILAGLMLVLIPIAPKMIALRIKALRFLRLKAFADFHERHHRGLITAVRIIMAAVCIVSLALGFEIL